MARAGFLQKSENRIPWLFHDWFASFHDSHSHMVSDVVMIVSHNMHNNHKVESCYSHENKQFHDFSVTSSYFPWLLEIFHIPRLFHDFPWQQFFSRIFQNFPWPWEPCKGHSFLLLKQHHINYSNLLCPLSAAAESPTLACATTRGHGILRLPPVRF